MKTKIATTLLICSFCVSLFAQNPTPSAPQLKSADVERFVTNFPEIKVELEKLDFEVNPQEDLESLTDGLESYDEVNSIVKKYGYIDYFDFAAKSTAIAACYTSIKLEKDGAASEISKAYAEIENDASLTVEQKSMAKQQLDMILTAMGGAITNMANEQDVTTVKAFESQLDALFEED